MKNMPIPTRKTSKAEAFKRFKANPDMGTFQMLWEMKESIPSLVEEAIKSVKEEARTGIQKEGIEALQEVLTEQVPGLVDAAVEKAVGAIKKANDGKTPERGVDYFTKEDKKDMARAILGLIRVPKDGKKGDPGTNGTTPKAGTDYPTKKQMEAMVDDAVGACLKELGTGERMTQEDVRRIATELQSTFDPVANAAKIARALETLQGSDALDYYALKNRPGVKLYDEEGKKLLSRHRGGGSVAGGSEALNYDLSAETDGVTKVFTIPANTRVLGVFGSQAPAGNYRPLVDWTRSATTLTLTSEVAAPEAGQTLWLIYVPV